MKRTRRDRCPHCGRPMNLSHPYAARHIAKPHVQCECGRAFTERGLAQHLKEHR